MDRKILPVILSGGAGSRLWPLSRQARPKQFLPLVSEATLLQETVRRVSGGDFLPPVFMGGSAHAVLMAEQMAEINADIGALLIEPVGRNTAPCAAIAALHAQDMAENPLVLLLPADHHISDTKAFRTAITQASMAAHTGHLVTFGIAPDRPETGYGYIQRGNPIDDYVCTVVAFKEKPGLETAKTYIKSGEYMWNAGIFLYDPEVFLCEMGVHAPDILKAARASYDQADRVGKTCHLEPESFKACPSTSIDYAVMETTDKAAVMPVSMGWTDIGSFAALHELIKGEDGNALEGDVVTHGVQNCHIKTDGLIVAAVGVEGLTIIVEEGRVLVLSNDAAQDVKQIVEALKAQDRQDRL